MNRTKNIKKHTGEVLNLYKTYFNNTSTKSFVLVLELLYRCNGKCNYCERWKSQEKGMLLVEDIEKIIRDLKSNNIDFSLTLTGGEPFIHPQIKEIIELIISNNIPLVLNTNGFNLEKYIDFLNENRKKIRSLNVSLDSPREKGHDEIRGVPGGFKKIVNNIKKIHSGMEVLLQATLTRDALYLMNEYADLAKSLGVEYRLQLVHESPDNLFKISDSNIRIPEAEFDKFKDYIDEFIEMHGSEFNYYQRIFYRLFPAYIKNHDEFKTIRCLAAGRYIYHIDPDGFVFPCENRRDVPLGNMRRSTIFDIISSEKTSAFRKLCKEGKNNCECLYGCVSARNILYQYFPFLMEPFAGFPMKYKWDKKIRELNEK